MQEIGKTILFYINKIENNTIYITEVLQTTNKTIKKNSEFLSSLAENLGSSNSLDSKMANNGTLDYDSAGAAKYIIVVVLLYGFGIIFFIGSQVRSTQKYSDDIEGVNAEKILRSMDTVIFTKEVMEKLSNKELREKAWKIYLDDKPSPDSIKESVTEAKHLLKIKTSENLDKEPLNNIDQKPQIFKIQHTDKTQTVNESKSGDKIRDFLNKKKSIEKKSLNQNLCAPKLILQTDAEGMENHIESKIRNKSNYNGENESKSIKNASQNLRSDSVTFDLFEISEKITSV